MGSFPETHNDRFQWNSEVWSLDIQSKHLEVKILHPHTGIQVESTFHMLERSFPRITSSANNGSTDH